MVNTSHSTSERTFTCSESRFACHLAPYVLDVIHKAESAGQETAVNIPDSIQEVGEQCNSFVTLFEAGVHAWSSGICFRPQIAHIS